MRILNPAGLKRFPKLENFFLGKHFWMFIAFFIAYNLVIGAIGITLYKKGLPDRLKQKIKDRVAFKSFPSNVFNGLVSSPEHIKIDIKHKHFQKLAYIRDASMKKGSLHDAIENDVPATIRHNGKAVRVELNVKGRLRDHWEHEHMWSFKVKVRNGNTVLGMSNFAIQRPRTRYYVNEWLLHKVFTYAGIMSLRYKFISVSINGKKSHIYAVEEGFEDELIRYNNQTISPLIKFDRDFYWSGGDAGGTNKTGLAQDLWGATIIPKSKKQMRENPAMLPVFKKGQSLLESFRRDELSTSEAFDVDKLATYFALCEVFGKEHLTTLDNVRFYYNPVTNMIEPITHDLGAFFRFTDRERYPAKNINSPLIGSDRPLGKDITRRKPSNWKLIPWFDAAFKDPIFYAEYVEGTGESDPKGFSG